MCWFLMFFLILLYLPNKVYIISLAAIIHGQSITLRYKQKTVLKIQFPIYRVSREFWILPKKCSSVFRHLYSHRKTVPYPTVPFTFLEPQNLRILWSPKTSIDGFGGSKFFKWSFRYFVCRLCAHLEDENHKNTEDTYAHADRATITGFCVPSGRGSCCAYQAAVRTKLPGGCQLFLVTKLRPVEGKDTFTCKEEVEETEEEHQGEIHNRDSWKVSYCWSWNSFVQWRHSPTE